MPTAHHPRQALAGHQGGQLVDGHAEGGGEGRDAGAGRRVPPVQPVPQRVGRYPEGSGGPDLGPVTLPGGDGRAQICIPHNRTCTQNCVPSRGDFAELRTALDWRSLDFYDFFISSLKNSGLSNTEFASRAGASKQHVTDMARKRRTPPLDRLDAWADALHLEGDRRAEFIRLAYLAHAPEQVRQLVEARRRVLLH